MTKAIALLISVLVSLAGGCGGASQDLSPLVSVDSLTVAWSSLGVAAMEFSVANHSGHDVTLTCVRLHVDKRRAEPEQGETNSCLGTKIEIGDLFFNISRDSVAPDLKEFGPQGGIPPAQALTIPAGRTRKLHATVFNHLSNGDSGKEVDACTVRVQIERNGATASSNPVKIHFNRP